MEKETRKELIKKFRELHAGGRSGTRSSLLAYAWLCGKPYVALERVINEDKFEQPVFGASVDVEANKRLKAGVFSALYSLAYSVAYKIAEFQKEPDQKWPQPDDGIRTAIYEWMLVKYENWTLKDFPKHRNGKEAA